MTKTDYLKKWLLEDLERKAVKIEIHKENHFLDRETYMVMTPNSSYTVISTIDRYRGACAFTSSNRPTNVNDAPFEAILRAYEAALLDYIKYSYMDTYDPMRSERKMILEALSQDPVKLPEIPKPARVSCPIEFREPGCRSL